MPKQVYIQSENICVGQLLELWMSSGQQLNPLAGCDSTNSIDIAILTSPTEAGIAVYHTLSFHKHMINTDYDMNSNNIYSFVHIFLNVTVSRVLSNNENVVIIS